MFHILELPLEITSDDVITSYFQVRRQNVTNTFKMLRVDRRAFLVTQKVYARGLLAEPTLLLQLVVLLYCSRYQETWV